MLDQIGTHLAEVKKCCRELADCCEMDVIDGKRSATCCKELEAALGLPPCHARPTSRSGSKL